MRVWKIVLGTVVAVAAIGAGFYFIDRREERTAAAAPGPGMMAMPVPVTLVQRKTIPIYLEFPGRTESIRNVTLQAKVSGYLKAQPAADGADVREGDLLYLIDPRDFQVALDQAEAQAQRDTASLDYARSSYGRGDQLAKSGWVAKDTFDQRESTMRQAEAALAMDDAAIRNAKLQLGYTEIRAPFTGRLGRNLAPVGTLVSAAGTSLNTLVQLDPIYVTFSASESDLAAIEEARKSGKIEADVYLGDEAQPHHSGELTFLDNAVDRSTGSITTRATISNADKQLLPGQYVRVRLHVRDQQNALLVPQTAIGSNQLGKYVYTVGAGNRVELRPVVLGATDGDLVSVVKGVNESDKVITGNLQKIFPGVPVQPLPPPKPAVGS